MANSIESIVNVTTMVSDIVAESGSVVLHKLRRQQAEYYVMECGRARGVGGTPERAAADLIRTLDERMAQIRADVLSTLAMHRYRDLEPGEMCSICGHIEGDCE